MDFEVKVGKDKIMLLGEGKELSWVEYSVDENTIDLLATFTAKGEEGKGYASRIVKEALDHARNFKEIKISCPYIKRWIEKRGFDRAVRFTELLRFKESLDKFNEFRAPEAVASFLKSEGDVAYVKFSGPFCVGCEFYDYFEDPIQDVNAEILGYEEVEDGFLVRYRIKESKD
jgi:hypothetical protein